MQQRQRQQHDEVTQWERDWREGVTKSLATTAQLANDTAGIVREMQNDVKELIAWRADLDKRRTAREDERRQLTRTDIGLVFLGASILIALIGPHVTLGFH